MDGERKLRQVLRHYHIFFIALSGIIGGGIFNNNGEALKLAGPAGLILSVVAIGILSICVSENISELVQQFPVPNALPTFVSEFVDKDLGWVVGIAYWYAFASVFAVQNLAAAQLAQYWGITELGQDLIFFALTPLLVIGINFSGVEYFGWIETVGGVLKVLLVFGVTILLWVIAGLNGRWGSKGSINDGFRNNPAYAANPNIAVCYSIPLVAFSFLGIEIVAVTAFEAKLSRDLGWPSRYIAYVVFALYFICTIGEALNMKWNDESLPKIYGGNSIGPTESQFPTSGPRSRNLVINVVWAAGYKSLAGFLNGALMFSVLSSSNTSLYVASRTLYGLAANVPKTNVIGKQLHKVSHITKNGIPPWSIFLSAFSFIWLPFLVTKGGYSIPELLQIIAVSCSQACLIVWASICLAYIRYYMWIKHHRDFLKEQHPEFYFSGHNYKPWTVLNSWMRPWPAILGLVGCIVVFGFASATWWMSKPNFTMVAMAYAAHVISLGAFIIFKCVNLRLWVRLDSDPSILLITLTRLKLLKVDEEATEEDIRLDELTRQHPGFHQGSGIVSSGVLSSSGGYTES